MSMKEQLKEGLQDIADENGRQVAEQVREEYVKNVRKAPQGASGLEEHVSDVKRARDASGQFTSSPSYTFDVEHPFAHLHEKGGPVEPTYGKAAAMGWTRDELYQSLKDCEEYVERKYLLRNAIARVRNRD